MDRELFAKQLKTAQPMSRENIDKVIFNSIESNNIDMVSKRIKRGHRNFIIIMEELAELSQEVSKELRGKGVRIDILQELADVQLAIYYIQELVGISNEELQKAETVKINNLKEKLCEAGVVD